ncbi:MAG: zinc-ribbon domain containing protein [Negativicutes bacterium]|nr:zinc-ribbon domain containing protein [Negativicutes bacterium]
MNYLERFCGNNNVAQDKHLICRDCKAPFVFSCEEQADFAKKGFSNAPSRCSCCRIIRKQRLDEAGRKKPPSQREMHDAVCTTCGIITQVPFRPSNGRAVYCDNCFNPHNNKRH